MNVKDVKAPERNGDRLQMIFVKQGELFDRYHEIERRNGLGFAAIVGTRVFSLDCPRRQYVMKEVAWRVTEEIGEALEALDDLDPEHTHEEMADALHFLIELCIIAKVDASDIRGAARSFVPTKELDGQLALFRLDDGLDLVFRAADSILSPALPIKTVSEGVRHFIRHLGCAMNCLKNKPWKTTQMETDREKFRTLVAQLPIMFALLAKETGMTADTTYDFYFRKAQVNEFRQRSAY